MKMLLLAAIALALTMPALADIKCPRTGGGTNTESCRSVTVKEKSRYKAPTPKKESDKPAPPKGDDD